MNWSDFFNSLPAGASLFWVIFYSLAASRTGTFRITAIMFIVLAAYLLAPNTLQAFITGTSLVPLMMHYLDRIRKNEDPPFYKTLWLVIPSTLFTVGLIVKYTATPDIQEVYTQKLILLYHIIVLSENLAFYGYLVFHCIRDGYRPVRKVYGFLFKHRPAKLLEIQYCLLGLCPIPFLLMAMPLPDAFRTPFNPLILTLLLYAAAYVSLAGHSREIALSDLPNIMRHNYNDKNKSEVVEAMIVDLLPEADPMTLVRTRYRIDKMLPDENEEKQSLASRIDSSVDAFWKNDALFDRFKKEIIDRQLFLRPGLSLQYVADLLNTNKTYVSKMVNGAYNMGFPELLNTMRVDYAQKFILRHPDARQSEVATACGFLSASSFNIIFKRITGQPPKLWAASNNELHKV